MAHRLAAEDPLIPRSVGSEGNSGSTPLAPTTSEILDKPTIPEVFDRFYAYYEKNPVWGSLHVVLDDGNLEDSTIRWCIDRAEKGGYRPPDPEGAELGRILLRMSRTQRSRLELLCSQLCHWQMQPPWKRPPSNVMSS
jgi:hypothetical protein